MSAASQHTLVDEITDFILTSPTLEQIIEFKISDALNERLHVLLDKHSEEGLTTDEQTELNSFLQISHILTVLTAKARLQLVS
jgi:hypothetical protein